MNRRNIAVTSVIGIGASLFLYQRIKKSKKMAEPLTDMEFEREKVSLEGVPETMLWILHTRYNGVVAGYLQDPKCVEIHDKIDYPFTEHFGTASHHAFRSYIFDSVVQDFINDRPAKKVNVVLFGNGLETERFRLETATSKVKYISVDLPEVIRIREKFIQPNDNAVHVACSVSELEKWTEHIDDDADVIITAQGLFMYLEPEQVEKMFRDIAKFFNRRKVVMVFDVISPWLSQRALSKEGVSPTSVKKYRAPPMPFGIKSSEFEATLKGWLADLDKQLEVEIVGGGIHPPNTPLYLILMDWIAKLSIFKDVLPEIFRVEIG